MRKIEPIDPFFKDCPYAIGMASSNQYVPYLAVYLQSIIDHVQPTNYYDIVVFETDISEENKQRIQSLAVRPNLSIRFFNLHQVFDRNLYISQPYFAKQCYYRLALGKAFEKYQKVIFTDIDILAVSDIFELFQIDMQGSAIGACEEILWTPTNRKGLKQLNYKIEDYIPEVLKLSGPYYNTGVMLIDIPRFNAIAEFSYLLETAQSKQFINLEQDVLNLVFNGHFYTLPNIFNFEIIDKVFSGETEDLARYAASVDKAKIYHFLAGDKVWFFPGLPKGYLWWNTARRTSYYEEILSAYIRFSHKQFVSSYFHYWKYKITSKLCFGKMKQRHLRKMNLCRENIK